MSLNTTIVLPFRGVSSGKSECLVLPEKLVVVRKTVEVVMSSDINVSKAL